jgi:hypothetical protein
MNVWKLNIQLWVIRAASAATQGSYRNMPKQVVKSVAPNVIVFKLLTWSILVRKTRKWNVVSFFLHISFPMSSERNYMIMMILQWASVAANPPPNSQSGQTFTTEDKNVCCKNTALCECYTHLGTRDLNPPYCHASKWILVLTSGGVNIERNIYVFVTTQLVIKF